MLVPVQGRGELRCVQRGGGGGAAPAGWRRVGAAAPAAASVMHPPCDELLTEERKLDDQRNRDQRTLVSRTQDSFARTAEHSWRSKLNLRHCTNKPHMDLISPKNIANLQITVVVTAEQQTIW